MSVFLLSMPMGDLTQPYTSLASLTAHLRRHGVDVAQRDFGIDFARWWSLRENAPWLLGELDTAIAGLEAGIGASEWEEYVDLKVARETLAGPILTLARDLEALRDPSIIEDLPRLRQTLALLGAFQTSLEHAERRALPDHVPFPRLGREEAMRVLSAPPEVHRRFIDAFVLPKIREAAPALVGISVTYPKQLLASLALCHRIREALPGTRIVLGGAYLSTIVETFFERPEMLHLWDFVVDGEGETALATLVDALAGRTPLENVPNLVYARDGQVVRSGRRHDEDIEELDPPDFRGLNLDQYLAPETVFLLPVARGCYMRCTFCAISYATQRYRCRSGPRIVADIRTIQAHFGEAACSFNFSIDVMTPPHLEEMATAIRDAGLGIRWDAEIRFDRTLRTEILRRMRDAGCRHLRFGLESAVDRVRDKMDKRIRMDRVHEILQDCRREDIKASTMCIVGFPGETEDEAEQTFRFLRDHPDWIRFFALSVYTVSRGSIIAAHPERFGVSLTPRPDLLVQPSFDFDVQEGIPTERARELVGQFRVRLKDAYPYSDEGFSVGIGGAFTFLVAARWTWDELRAFDGAARASATGNVDIGSVPALVPLARSFVAPYRYGGSTPTRASELVRYLVSPSHQLVELEGPAADVLELIDGARTVGEIARALDPGAGTEEIASLCGFVQTLAERGFLVATGASA